MRDRARIVLLASAGMASRAIARAVGCTPGTASKWRVRYAHDRMAALSETGDRGNEPKYGPEHGQRASWRCWISHHPLGIPIGQPRCWRANWWTSTVRRRSIYRAANPGAK